MIMQQYLEKSFPMAAELTERQVDLLAYQVRNVTLSDKSMCMYYAKMTATMTALGLMGCISCADKKGPIERLAHWL
jgi:hypothetical protein